MHLYFTPDFAFPMCRCVCADDATRQDHTLRHPQLCDITEFWAAAIILIILVELALIAGCSFYAKYRGHERTWGLLGLLGPIGVVLIACLEDRTKPSSESQPPNEIFAMTEDMAKPMSVLYWLFWGSVVLGIASSVVSPETWTSARELVSCILGDLASILLVIFVLKGARWARVSCYVLSITLYAVVMMITWLLILLSGWFALYDIESVKESIVDFDSSMILGLMDFACFMVGTMFMLRSKAQETFKKMKVSTRFGWLLCVLFWMLISASLVLGFFSDKDDGSAAKYATVQETAKE